MNLYFPGDDSFAPHERRRGLPLGNLTSQFFANLYLDRFDHFVTEVLRAPYVRYVDDFALFHDDPAVLAAWRERIAAYLAGRARSYTRKRRSCCPRTARSISSDLRWSRTVSGACPPPVYGASATACGPCNTAGAKNGDAAAKQKIGCRIQSWVAHASHTNSWRLRQAIFKRSWFDPATPLKPERLPAGGCFAAVPGTTIQRIAAPPPATGTPRTTATTIAASVWPVHFSPELGDHGPARRAIKCPGPFMMRSPGA